MMLGPVLAMVNGPIVADAIRDPANHIVKFTEATKDDARVVEEVYLSVLNRRPTPAELEVGVTAIRGAGVDHADLKADYEKRKWAFDTYARGVDAKIPAYEALLRQQRPTAWYPLLPKTVESKAGATPAAATTKDGSTLTVQPFGAVLVSGKLEASDTYTVSFHVKQNAPLVGLRLEALSDPSLPAKGPGRAQNGNFVLNELKVYAKGPNDTGDVGKRVKLKTPQATFQQDGFPINNAIDENAATGWAIAPQLGKTQTAVFLFEKPVDAKNGITVTVYMDHRYGTGHNLGKFRYSFTTDKNPKLASPVAADVVAILDTPAAKRSAEQTGKLRAMFIAQDGEYQRLQRDIPIPPPADPRAVGAQDLAWALINTPAFLFNR
jgi:hypothetical protein